MLHVNGLMRWISSGELTWFKLWMQVVYLNQIKHVTTICTWSHGVFSSSFRLICIRAGINFLLKPAYLLLVWTLTRFKLECVRMQCEIGSVNSNRLIRFNFICVNTALGFGSIYAFALPMRLRYINNLNRYWSSYVAHFMQLHSH